MEREKIRNGTEKKTIKRLKGEEREEIENRRK